MLNPPINSIVVLDQIMHCSNVTINFQSKQKCGSPRQNITTILLYIQSESPSSTHYSTKLLLGVGLMCTSQMYPVSGVHIVCMILAPIRRSVQQHMKLSDSLKMLNGEPDFYNNQSPQRAFGYGLVHLLQYTVE